jgi:hypothetical protein
MAVHMGLFFLALGLALVSQIWLSIRVGRSNTALAVVTLVIGFPGALYTFLRHRGNDELSVTRPFVANLVFSLLLLASIWLIVFPLLDAQSAEFEKSLAVAAPAGMAASAGEHAAAPVRPASAAQSASAVVAAAASAAEPAASAPTVDSVEAFSVALRSVGVNHTVTRMAAAASAALPSGVTSAALFSVTGMSPASSASSPAGNELSATLFSCESLSACRSLAGAQMQQGGPDKRRVLQNGLLLLSMPPVVASDADLTPAAVVSAFRKL